MGEQGFNNISISIGDFEPQPQFLPTFTFARGIFLRAEYDQVFIESPQILHNGGVTGTYLPSLAVDAGVNQGSSSNLTAINLSGSAPPPIQAQTVNPLPDPIKTPQGMIQGSTTEVTRQGSSFNIYTKGGTQ
jgi:hypothetical protein